LVSGHRKPGGGIFVVTAGQLRVYLTCGGNEFTLLFLEAGDIFSLHTSAMIEARLPSTILMTDLASFSAMLFELPHMFLSAFSTLGRMLNNQTKVIEDLVFHDLKGRLLRLLIEQAERNGRETEAGVEIQLPWKTEEMAMLVGSTRQSVSSALNELIRQGLIVKHPRRRIVIADLNALRRLRDASAGGQLAEGERGL